MRRTWAILLLCGCFSEAERVEETTIAATMTTEAVEESSSSSDAGSSSEDTSESSSTGVDPYACPEWCTESCDLIIPFERCRCTNDAVCELGGLMCYRPDDDVGHCL